MKQRDFLIILSSFFILTVLWVIFNIYHSFVTSTIKDPLSVQIIPIEGTFDLNTINKLKARKRVSPLYEIQPQISGVPEELEETEISTQSSEILPTETPQEEENE
ncbi:MAG: hypothetical protein HYW63_00635 [Candidatus Levybacteria bacterium]|nr:hypothetical protein [Candidatus Levybacteria bacterium]